MSNQNDDTVDSHHYVVLEYLYRDAANWKAWGKVLLRGSFTVADLTLIESKLEAGEFFIPEQVGLESLTSNRFLSAGGISQNDHLWHEFETVRIATSAELAELSVWGTTDKFLELLYAVDTWDPRSSPQYAAFANAISTTDVVAMTHGGGK
ncbi:MAG: hypothetical protein ABI583_04255 [Betaproteobacteria bacterium]